MKEMCTVISLNDYVIVIAVSLLLLLLFDAIRWPSSRTSKMAFVK